MNKFITLATFALLATAALSQGCGKYCLSCRGATCNRCWRHQNYNGKCSSSRDSTCLIFLRDGSFDCTWCEEGYALGYNSRQCLSKFTPRNCVSAITDRNGNVGCAVCENFRYPSNDGSCGNRHNNQQCVYAAKDSNGNPRCIRCIEGWVVNPNGTCSRSQATGCLKSNNPNTCTDACNPWEGYAMVSGNQRCVYKGLSSTENVMNPLENFKALVESAQKAVVDSF